MGGPAGGAFGVCSACRASASKKNPVDATAREVIPPRQSDLAARREHAREFGHGAFRLREMAEPEGAGHRIE
jgi:hypothetical protein